jgi:transcriptional regulator with XRE-family HTH domain
VPELKKTNVGDNLFRLMGLHSLSAKEATILWGISPQAISAWRQGKSEPSMTKLILLSEFFEIAANRLALADFGDLLENELASRERFERVERKIRGRERWYVVSGRSSLTRLKDHRKSST